MLIQILSDLHNEFWGELDIPKTNADIVVLAGDIDIGTKGITWAKKQQQRLGIPIIIINGNHEYYRHDYNELNKQAALLYKEDKLIFLNNNKWIYKDIRFIGSTLWTDFRGIGSDPTTELLAMRSVETNLVDYIHISDNKKKIKANHTKLWHEQSKFYLINELEQHFNGKTVVITHHAPSMRCHDLIKYGPADYITTGFCSNLDWLIQLYKPTLWIYGHSHSNIRIEDQFTTRIVTNQRGYPRENVKEFIPDYVIEI